MADRPGEAAERERVIRAYTAPGHPTAYSAPAAVARFHHIPQARAKRHLEHAQPYTLHREYKGPRAYNPYYVHGRREEVQADLIDVSKLAAHNDGIRFLLLYIDIFTKRVWVHALRRKSAVRVERAIRHWLTHLDAPPRVFTTDLGLEFRNRAVQALLREFGVEWRGAVGTLKACFAERANKLLQILIHKYLTHGETLRYVDKLRALVRTYNTRGHRTLEGMSPRAADRPANEAAVQAILHAQYERRGRGRARRQANLRFRVGDLVRLKTHAGKVSSSRRAYAQQFHGEYYRVVRINRTLPIPMFHLRLLDTGELIKGGLYAEQLQRQRGNIFLIERVFMHRVRRGVPWIFVKWMWFGPRWNEWIREDSVVRAY